MRSHYANDMSSGFLEEVHNVLSSGDGWATNGANISIPRRHLASPKRPPRHGYNSNAIDEMFAPWSSTSGMESNFDHPSQPETLSDALHSYKVSNSMVIRCSTHRNFLGVAPGALSLLEIFPPALQTFNTVVTNLLVQPRLLLPNAGPSKYTALAMYFASKAAQCTYSTLHTCHLALRRGAAEGVFSGKRRLSAREAAVAAVASNMCAFPPALTYADRQRLHAVLSRSAVDSVVLAVSLMGMLNLTMTALAVDLDKNAVDAVGALASAAGWTSGNHRIVDNSISFNRNYRAPSAPTRGRYARKPDRQDHQPSRYTSYRTPTMAYERQPFRARSLRAFGSSSGDVSVSIEQRKRGVPKSWPAVGDFLTSNIGHSFPIFSRLRNGRAVRALATALLLNLDEHECSIDVEIKYLAAVIYATLNGNHLMSNEFARLASNKQILAAVSAFAADNTPVPFSRHALADTVLTPSQKRILYVAKACSMSPPVITPRMVKLMRDHMPPPQIVELVTWLGLISTFHRLYVYYLPNCLDRNFLHQSALADEMDDNDAMSEMSFN